MSRAQINVDLNKVRENTALLKKRAGTNDFMAVVKANGYGHGALRVAEAALEGGATWLGVATLREGAELRSTGLECPILILSEPEPTKEVVSWMSYGNLTPTVYTKKFIEAFARQSPMGAEVHLKVDTGMHRVGCSPSEALDLALEIRSHGLTLGGVFTHLSSADSSVTETRKQLQIFDEVFTRVASQTTMAHVLNTPGVLNFPDCRYDMVRCGIGLYGITGNEFGLQPVLSFTSHLSYVRWLPAGSGVGYGLKWKSERDGYVGVIPAGYADGIPVRSAGRGWVVIEDRRYPIVAVTMDMIMVDLGRAVLEPGTEVELIGKNISVSEWQNWLDVIGYEVLCGLGTRINRSYE